TLDRLTALGTVRKAESSKNQQVPAGPLARARFDVTLGSPAPIVSPEDGVGASFRKGLHYSLSYLAYSLMLIVIGVCLVGPFAPLIWAGWKAARRGRTRPAATAGVAAKRVKQRVRRAPRHRRAPSTFPLVYNAPGRRIRCRRVGVMLATITSGIQALSG